jgi:hypothetical protein
MGHLVDELEVVDLAEAVVQDDLVASRNSSYPLLEFMARR